MVILKVEKTPEDPAKVAMELAEAMQSQFLHEGEIRHYTILVEQERVSLRALTQLIFDVRERRKSAYVAKRRMDPWAEYDLDSLEAERVETKTRATKYADIIKEQQHLLRKHTTNIPRIRARLTTANAEAARLGRN